MERDDLAQGKVFSAEELRRLFTLGFLNPRDRALFGICLYTNCRVREALALQTTDIESGSITFRQSITKGQQQTRIVEIHPELAAILCQYQPQQGAMFKSDGGVTEHLTQFMASEIFRAACSRIGLEGFSIHSLRLTALTLV